MKDFTSLSFAALLSSATALKVAQFDIQGTHPSIRAAQALRKRDSFEVSLANDVSQGAYFVNLTIGTPPQPIALQLDTGSSELWVLKEGIAQCQNTTCGGGFFNPNASSTYEVLVYGGYNNSYGSGAAATYAKGDTATDTITVGNATVEKQHFSVVNDTTQHLGIMGVGYAINEADCARNGGNCKPYATFIDNLQEQDIISTIAYSMWLNDLNASSGSLLFGGVDSSKYTGDLVVLPIVADEGVYHEFTVSLTNMSVTSSGGSIGNIWSNGAVYNTLLDSGTTMSLLPQEVFNGLLNLTGAQYVTTPDGGSTHIVDCNILQSDVTVDFQFGGPTGVTIRVPLRELFFVVDSSSAVNTFTNGDKICYAAFLEADSTEVILGDVFLRSAYVVYDISNNQLALAQTNFNPGQANVQEIGNTIPGAVRTASAYSAAPVSATSETKVAQTLSGTPVATSGYPLQSFATATFTGGSVATTTAAAGSGSGSAASSSAAKTSGGSNAASAAMSPSMQKVLTAAFSTIFAIAGAGMILL